ncbi:YdcH family protein [Loktanella sp. R86503]|uniref:YdcH family protein n=1 Tax=Loktanella TaxID=245186 RepID=UPI0036DC504A
MNSSSRMSEAEILTIELAVLRGEHRDLDLAITALQARHPGDVLTLKRLKKKKLSLKDLIARLEDRLNPDIIA